MSALLDGALDLQLERLVDVPVDQVWEAWTKPEHVRRWFVPAPWFVAKCEIDLRPGGRFHVVMQSPEGETCQRAWCYLEIVPRRLLIYTDALQPGFRPSAEAFSTAIIRMEPEGSGTRYSATAVHGTAAQHQRHLDMGYTDGAAKVHDQLMAYVRTLQRLP